MEPLSDVADMKKLMAGFERTVPGPVSRGLRAGRTFRTADEIQQVPAGLRHAVWDGDQAALCGRSIVTTNGEWFEKRGLGFRDCSACTKAVADNEEVLS